MSIYDETQEKCGRCGKIIKSWKRSYHDTGKCLKKENPKKEMNKYCLTQDNDGHWFICPWSKRGLVQEYFDAIDTYWCGLDWEDEEKREPEQPEWLKRIDNPYMVSFENWKEEE